MEYIDKTPSWYNKHSLSVNCLMGDEEVLDAGERGEVWDNLTTAQLDQVMELRNKLDM